VLARKLSYSLLSIHLLQDQDHFIQVSILLLLGKHNKKRYLSIEPCNDLSGSFSR